jgi:hypothetical protein
MQGVALPTSLHLCFLASLRETWTHRFDSAQLANTHTDSPPSGERWLPRTTPPSGERWLPRTTPPSGERWLPRTTPPSGERWLPPTLHRLANGGYHGLLHRLANGGYDGRKRLDQESSSGKCSRSACRWISDFVLARKSDL